MTPRPFFFCQLTENKKELRFLSGGQRGRDLLSMYSSRNSPAVKGGLLDIMFRDVEMQGRRDVVM